MGLVNRHAPEDTALNRPIMDQNIDVRGPGRYYPEEYSGQIQAIQHRGSVLSEIPKSLAGIIESYDDYKISSWSDDEDVAISRERLEAQNEVHNYELAKKLETSIDIYDEQKRMQSDIQNALEQADRDGIDQVEAANAVLEQYQNPDRFEGKLGAQQMWTSTFQQNALNTLAKAQANDIQTIHAKREAALRDLIFTGYGEVIAGRENPEQSLNRMIPQMLELAKDLPAVKVQEIMDGAWNQLVLADAQKIIEAVQRGTITTEAGMTALRSLAAEYTQKTFTCADANGNPIKNPDGSDKTFTLTLTATTQNELYRVFKDVKSGGAGGGDEILVDYLDGFKERIGWKEYTETGTTSKLLDMSHDELKSFMTEQLDLVQNSKGSDSKKAATMTEMLKMYSQVETFYNVANALKGGHSDVKEFLNTAITQLEGDLKNFNGDWANYVLTVNGHEIGLAGIHNTIPQLGSLDNASAIYWSEAAKSLRKLADLVTNGSVGEVFAKIDKTCSNAGTYLAGFTAAGELVKGEGYTTCVNQEGVKKLRAAISQFDGTISKYGFGYTALPESFIDDIAKNLSSVQKGFGDPVKRYMGTRAVVQAFTEMGHISDLMTYAAKHSGEGRVGSDFVFALCMNQKNLDAGLAADMTNLVIGTNVEQAKTYEQSLSGAGLKNRSALESEVFKELQIPEMHKPWYSQVSKMCAYLTVKNNGNASDFKKYFKQMISTNYVKMDRDGIHKNSSKTKLNGSVFIHAPYMRNFQGEEGRQRLQNILLETNKNISSQLNNIGIGNRWNDMAWHADDQLGIFRLVEKGKGFGGYNGSQIGGLYYSDALKGAEPSSIGAVNATAFTASLLATNPNILSTAMEKGKVYYTDAEAKKMKAGLRNTLKTAADPGGDISRTLKESYYGQTHNVKKDATILMNTLTNPKKMKSAINRIDSPQLTNRGTTQTQMYMPDMKLLRALYGINPHLLDRKVGEAGPQDFQTAPLSTGKSIEGTITGPAANIDYDSIKAIMGETDSATKINQNDVSIPISMAGVGNEEYGELISIAQAAGFSASDSAYPGVVMSDIQIPEPDELEEAQIEIQQGPRKQKLQGGPTGFAANIMTPMFSGDQITCPNTDGRMYSKNEIAQMVNHYANVFGIPPQLANALVNQESGGQQYVVSPKGATGITQLMPATAKALGVKDSKDAAQNIWGGMKYLAQQYKQFGNWDLALAAYNAGPGAVSKYKGIPPYKETQNYVKNILAKAGMNFGASSYPINFDLNNDMNKRKYIDQDTGGLSVKGMNDFIYLINNSETYKNKIEQIKTNRPELLENKPEYADFKKYRDMKTADGKPLFVKGTYSGFQVMIKKDKAAMSGLLNVAALEGIGDDAYNHQTDALGKFSSESIQALVNTFSSRYNSKPRFNSLETFGLAALSPAEYEEYGVPLAAQQNPIMQARVLTAEFQRANDLLGSERKAVFALAGGSLKDANGTIKSWSEIKKDKEAFKKQWFIQPSSDKQERDTINELVAMYNSEYNKIKGIF